MKRPRRWKHQNLQLIFWTWSRANHKSSRQFEPIYNTFRLYGRSSLIKTRYIPYDQSRRSSSLDGIGARLASLQYWIRTNYNEKEKVASRSTSLDGFCAAWANILVVTYHLCQAVIKNKVFFKIIIILFTEFYSFNLYLLISIKMWANIKINKDMTEHLLILPRTYVPN